MTGNEIDKRAPIGALDPTDQKVLAYLGLNPDNPADRAVVAVCRRYDLDPVLKHVIVIPKGGVYITRDGLLHVAHMSGQLDGIEVVQEPTLIDGEWVARVAVWRKDMGRPFTYPGRYPVSGSNRQYAQEMAMKAAEAHALRRAFSVSGIAAFDEQRDTTVRQASPLSEALGHHPTTETVDETTGEIQDAEIVPEQPENDVWAEQ